MALSEMHKLLIEVFVILSHKHVSFHLYLKCKQKLFNMDSTVGQRPLTRRDEKEYELLHPVLAHPLDVGQAK